MMKTFEFNPNSFQLSMFVDDALSIVNSGSNPSNSFSVGRMNILCEK